MRFLHGRPRPMLATVALAALLLAACGKSTTTTSHSGGSTGVANAMSIETGKVTGIGMVLANSEGLTLYHNTQETGGKIVCTGACATAWPPVLVPGALPAGSPVIKGTFGTVKRPDGTTQLTFDGMPLYTYSGDSASGQDNGQGLGGVWFAVAPTGASSSGQMGTTSGGSSGISGGKGYSSTSSGPGGYSSSGSSGSSGGSGSGW